MKQLYIHIGTGKTGTTALQNFLDLNNNQLEKFSIKYADTFKFNSLHHKLCINFTRQKFNYEDRVIEVKKALQVLIEEAKNSSCKKIIISSEDFPGVTEDEIKNIYIDELGKYFDINVIVYLRRQDEYLESWNAQLIKTGTFTSDIYSLKNQLSSKGLFDYYSMIEKWSKYIGKQNIHVKVYEKGQFFKQNIFNDFMTIFDILEIEGFQFPPKDPNPSLTIDQILLIKAFYNADCSRFLDNIIKKPFNFDIGSSKNILSPSERTDLILEYDELNKKVANTFLQRKDEKLFYNPLPIEIEKDWKPKEFPSTEFLIRSFTHLLAKQRIHFESEINFLKQELKLIQER